MTWMPAAALGRFIDLLARQPRVAVGGLGLCLVLATELILMALGGHAT